MNRSQTGNPGSPVILWAVFGCFWAANSLLAFYHGPWTVKAGIGVVGILLPFVLALWPGVFRRIRVPFKEPLETFPAIPWAGWLLMGAAAVGMRFYSLRGLSLWPLEDEAMNAHYALELAEWGRWQWTYDFSGMPPLYVWGLGVFFKCFGVSLGSLWFFPAVFSLAAVGLAFAGARHFFSKALSFLFTSFWAVSFWPLYAGRFSVQGGLMVFWMSLVFYLLGLFWNAESEKEKRNSSLGLGVCAGLGFYTFTSWAVVAFVLTLWLFHKTIRGGAREWGRFLWFLVPEVLLFLLLAWATLPERAGHFRYVLQNPFGQGWPGLNDLAAVFWGSRLPANLFAYKPFWGGFLNPLLGALCFSGFLALRRAGFALWKQGLLLLLLLLPGWLTGGLDGHRVIQCVPFLLLAASFGLASLAATLPVRSRWLAAGACLALSGGMDAYHLFGVYHSIWTHPKDNWFASKSVERRRAFSILEQAESKMGPGLILTDLVPDIYDQSLSVLAYPINGAQNSRIRADSCAWVALLANVHYQPTLARRFPQARWFDLSTDIAFPDGGLMLGVIPLPVPDPAFLNQLILADRASHALADLVYDNHDWKSQKPVQQALFAAYPLFQADPFLEACFWEKIAECAYGDLDQPSQVAALRQALARGIPTAHLYNELGALLMRGGKFSEARDCFKKALLCRPNHTSAAAGITALDNLEKKGVKPQDE